MDYIIKFTDTQNGQFTIKPYTTNGPASPNDATPLALNAVSANTSLILLGKGMYEYGESVASDLVHMLENFSNSSPPTYPIQGQLWYKNDTQELFVFDDDEFSTQKIIIDGKLTTEFNANQKRLSNIAAPTNDDDAVTKIYMESNTLTLAGGSFFPAANITLSSGGEILGLPNVPSVPNASASKWYVDYATSLLATNSNSTYIYKSGDVNVGTLNMATNSHIYLPTPSGGFISGTDVVNKSYIDGQISGGGSGIFVAKAGDVMTGPLVINGQNLYTGATRTVVGVTTGVGVSTISISGDWAVDFGNGTKALATLGAVSGYQTVNVGGAIIGGTATGLDINSSEAAAGTATITITSSPVVTPSTLVSLPAGPYSVTLTIDGGSATHYDITATGTDTVSSIAALLDTAIAGVTVTALTNVITFISTTTGATSTVTITEPTGGTNPDLFATMDTEMGATHVAGSTPGTDAIVHPPYTVDIAVDGNAATQISVVASAAQTYTTLISEINADLSGAAVASLVGGNIRITSASTGISSTIAISSDGLFLNLTDYVAPLGTAVPGVASTQQVITVNSALFSTPNTILYIADTLTNASTSGSLASIPGLKVQGGTNIEIEGNLKVIGTRTIDMGNNYIKNVLLPIAATDAANKAYVDAFVGGVGGADGTLVSGSYDDLTQTLSLISTISPMVNIDLSDLAKAVHTHPLITHTHFDNEVFHNVRSPNSTVDNKFRNSLSTLTQPKVSISDVLDYVGNELDKSTSPNDRHVTTVINYTITDVSTPLAAALTVTSVTTGAGGTVTITGGDYTGTFKAGVKFNIYGNTGAGGVNSIIPLTTASSTYNAGPTTTVITVAESIAVSTTNDGTIDNLFGQFKIAGNVASVFDNGAILFEIAGNTGGGNGTFLPQFAFYTGTDTWIQISDDSPGFPLNGASTGDGTIQLYSYVLPFYYTVGYNKLMTFDNGLKKYKSTTGIASIINTGTAPIAITDTTLANGTYSINVAKDGGANTQIDVVVARTSYTITAIDIPNKKITVSGLHASEFFELESIKLIGNTGLGVTTSYTIVSATLNGANTDIIVTGTLTGATNDGTIRQPYEYQHLVNDLTQSLSAAFSVSVYLRFDDGKITITSSKQGATSQIAITDISLVAALPTSAISNGAVGVSYGYTETGPISTQSNIMNFVALPTIGNVLEFINTK